MTPAKDNPFFDEGFMKALADLSNERAAGLVRSARENVVRLLEQCFLPEWKVHETNESAVTVKLRTSESGNACVYGEVECPFAASLVMNYLSDVEKQPRYEDHYVEGRVLEKLPLDSRVLYLRFKKYIVASERDFVLRQQVLRLEQGLDPARWGWQATPEQEKLFSTPGILVQAGSSIIYPNFDG